MRQLVLVFSVLILFLLSAVRAEEVRFDAYPPNVVEYLSRAYTVDQGQFAFREDYPGGYDQWQRDARAKLIELLRLEKIAVQTPDFTPVVTFDEAPEDLGDYTRQLGSMETEPSVHVPFYLLRPKGEGPFPLGIFPHGHSDRGHRTHAAVWDDDAHRSSALRQDRDVAVQAVKRGFLAIAPAVRGLSADGVPDLNDRHGGRSCRSQLMHCLIAGRTAMGERVWDMQRFLDWALALSEVDSAHVLMMGNSGGGMITIYTAACDTRVTIAVPSCSFSELTSDAGYIFHCDCNQVPGILELGDLPDVAGLAAPRYLLAVSGKHDDLHSNEIVERAAAHTQQIFGAAGVSTHFEHRQGDKGHHFYSDLMWPFIENAMGR
jgi:hypothetical protein